MWSCSKSGTCVMCYGVPERPLTLKSAFVPQFDLEIIHLANRSVTPHMYRMEAHTPSLDQLRNNAAECIRLAEAARTSAHRSLFIEMAERWLTLAEHAE